MHPTFHHPSDDPPKHPLRDYLITGVVVSCISVGLYIDGSASLPLQNALGVVAWICLITLLYTEEAPVRFQVATMVMCATAMEYFAAPTWAIYTYRFDNVPAYIPPGHGMVYLAAVELARSAFFHRHQRLITKLTLGIGGTWAFWGITLADRGDAGGAALFGIFAAFVILGRAPLLYSAAFFLTSYLELVGTSVGTWVWADHQPLFGLTHGNPPSGIAAGYCVLDTAAMLGAPYLAELFYWVRGVLPSPAGETDTSG
jgi:hypothetical protein